MLDALFVTKPTLAAIAGRISLASGAASDGAGFTAGRIKTEVLSGLTVALALVPEAVAFSFVAGVHPLVGLYAAFIVGLITALIGGRPGMISGATGALAVVMVALVADHGVQYLLATVVLMGILQLLAGVFRLGKFIRLVPHPVMLGFVNGLAIVIFMAQLTQFQIPAGDAGGEAQWMTGLPLVIMLGLVALTMAIIWGMPKLTNAIPAPLAGIAIVAGIVIAFGIDVPRVGDLASIKGGLPEFGIPTVPLTLETLKIIFPYALILAAIGLIESLLTLNLVGEITEKRGGASQECIAQGVANTVTGFFGGMGGCAMIGQSIINIQSGGRTRLSGVVASLGLLGFILFGASMIEMVPIAALVGVMFMVVIGTFAWNTFRILNKVPASDVAVMALVTGLTVVYDLALAVLCGVIVSALVFAWENALRIRARKFVDERGVKHYEIYGPLFFGSTTLFASKFDVAGDPEEVVVDFAESRIVDQSAIEAINKLAERYQAASKTLRLRHLSPDCTALIRRAEKICDVNVLEDPEYFVAVNDYRTAIEKTLAGGSGRLEDADVHGLAREGRALQRRADSE